MRYIYLGDKHTDPALRGMPCDPVRRPDGRCVVSTAMASALVQDAQGRRYVVARRRLRLQSKIGANYAQNYDQIIPGASETGGTT